MAENVEVAVVGTKLEEDVFWPVPLVQFLPHDIRDHPYLGKGGEENAGIKSRETQATCISRRFSFSEVRTFCPDAIFVPRVDGEPIGTSRLAVSCGVCVSYRSLCVAIKTQK